MDLKEQFLAAMQDQRAQAEAMQEPFRSNRIAALDADVADRIARIEIEEDYS